MTKPEKRWQFLLVADDGRIIPLKRIKGMVIALVILLMLLGLLCAGLGWQLHAEKTRHRRTLERLADANRQMAHYKSEQEMTAAELVLAEARMEKAGLPVPRRQAPPQSPVKTAADEAAADSGQEEGRNEIRQPESVPTSSQAAPEQKQPAAAAPPPSTAHASKTPEAAEASPQPTATIKKPSVELGDLKMRYNAEKQILLAQFQVKNAGPRSSPVAGRCVVVLKSDRVAPSGWLAMPAVPLVDGKPDGKQGQSFKISNFIRMDIKAAGKRDFSVFSTATVYVFGIDGDKMLEKDFPIDLPSPPAEPDSGTAPASPSADESLTPDTTTQTAPDKVPSLNEDAEPAKTEDSRARF